MSTVLVISGAHSSRHARRVSRVPPFIQNKNTSAPSTSTLCVRRQLLSGQGVRRLISFQCLRSPEVSMTVPQAQPAYRRGRPVVEVTNVEEMTSILEGLHASCGKWHAMPSKQKISILQQVRRRAVKASMDLGKATAKVSVPPRCSSSCSVVLICRSGCLFDCARLRWVLRMSAKHLLDLR